MLNPVEGTDYELWYRKRIEVEGVPGVSWDIIPEFTRLKSHSLNNQHWESVLKSVREAGCEYTITKITRQVIHRGPLPSK